MSFSTCAESTTTPFRVDFGADAALIDVDNQQQRFLGEQRVTRNHLVLFFAEVEGSQRSLVLQVCLDALQQFEFARIAAVLGEALGVEPRLIVVSAVLYYLCAIALDGGHLVGVRPIHHADLDLYPEHLAC